MVLPLAVFASVLSDNALALLIFLHHHNRDAGCKVRSAERSARRAVFNIYKYKKKLV